MSHYSCGGAQAWAEEPEGGGSHNSQWRKYQTLVDRGIFGREKSFVKSAFP